MPSRKKCLIFGDVSTCQSLAMTSMDLVVYTPEAFGNQTLSSGMLIEQGMSLQM